MKSMTTIKKPDKTILPSSQMNPGANSEKHFLVIIGFAVICWGFAFPLIKVGLRELSPVGLTILRLLIVSIVFLLIFLIMPKRFSPLQKQDVIPIFLLGFTGIVLYHLSLNYGELYVSAGAASLIIATIPIFVVILAAVFLQEKITARIITGIILALSGVFCISVGGGTGNAIIVHYFFGALAVLFAAFVGASYTIAGKKLLQRYTPLSLTAYAFLLGTPGLLPFLNTSVLTEFTQLSMTGWAAVFFLAFFPTVIAYVLWYIALEMKPASEISVYLYFTPVISTILGVIMFNEIITPLFLLGGGLIIVGLAIANSPAVSKNHK